MEEEGTTYLLSFSYELLEFRLPELEAVLSLLGKPARWQAPDTPQPFLEVEFSCEEDARAVVQHTVGVKSCMELWAAADTDEQLEQKLRRRLRDRPQTMLPYFAADKSFKVHVEMFNKNPSHAEKLARVESFAFLPLEGPVRLQSPDVRLDCVEDYGRDPNAVPALPQRLYFGRWVCDGARAVIARHSLKTRAYIGNTSMDPELALVMANMARVRRGDLVLDPFCGTGSLLVAAAYCGGHVLGTDIDFLTVHARTRPSRAQERGRRRGRQESIAANLAQYGLQSQLVDVLVADAALPKMWRTGLAVDAIVTDPPYGVREATARVGSARANPIPDELRPGHFPAKTAYAPAHLFADLLQLAADRLPVGGRLVFWLPVLRVEYSEETLPAHPCLKLVANSEQVLTRHCSRRLVTMEKWREPVSEDCAAIVHETTGRFARGFFRREDGQTETSVTLGIGERKLHPGDNVKSVSENSVESEMLNGCG